MMNLLADTLMNLAQAAAPAAAQGSSFFSHFGLDGWAAGGAASGLAALWIFTKVIRKVVGTLFMFCMAYLVFKSCFDIDLAPMIKSLFGAFGM